MVIECYLCVYERKKEKNVCLVSFYFFAVCLLYEKKKRSVKGDTVGGVYQLCIYTCYRIQASSRYPQNTI